MSWLFLAGAIVLEVTATLCLRASDGFGRWAWAIPIVLGYAGAFALLSLVLKHGMPVGVAYGIWAAAGVALTAVLGRVVFGDPFTWVMAAGVVLIGAGVLLLEVGSAMASEPAQSGVAHSETMQSLDSEGDRNLA